MWVITLMFNNVFGFGQNPIQYQKLDQVPGLPDTLVPDHDLYGTNFFRWNSKNEQWEARPHADEVYAYALNKVGEGNFSPRLAMEFVVEASQGKMYEKVAGYPGSLCYSEKEGKWVISFPEKPVFFSGFFVSRINDKWAYYGRNGCNNLTPVPDTIQKSFGFKGDPIPPKCDTVKIHDTLRIETPAPPPCNNCCPGDSIKYTVEPFFVIDFERVGGKLQKGIGGGIDWTQYYLFRNDKDEDWIEKPTSLYAGLTAYLAKKGLSFLGTCDTCGYWGDIPGGLVFWSDVYFGIQHRVFKRYGVFGFIEVRYDWINTEHQRKKFLGDEGIKARGGLRIKLETPRKMPIFRSVQVELGPQVSTYATPNKNLAVSAGGFLELRVNLGKRDKEVRHEQDSIRRAQTYQQFQQDSIKREGELNQFLVESPQPIVLDSSDMMFQVPVPTAKGGYDKSQQKVASVNLAKLEVHRLVFEQNELKQQVIEGDDTKRAPLAKNIRELKNAQRKLDRLQKKKAKKS